MKKSLSLVFLSLSLLAFTAEAKQGSAYAPVKKCNCSAAIERSFDIDRSTLKEEGVEVKTDKYCRISLKDLELKNCKTKKECAAECYAYVYDEEVSNPKIVENIKECKKVLKPKNAKQWEDAVKITLNCSN